MKKTDNTDYTIWLGVWLAFVIPATIWVIWEWKVALVFFVVTQFILMFLKSINKKS